MAIKDDRDNMIDEMVEAVPIILIIHCLCRNDLGILQRETEAECNKCNRIYSKDEEGNWFVKKGKDKGEKVDYGILKISRSNFV